MNRPLLGALDRLRWPLVASFAIIGIVLLSHGRLVPMMILMGLPILCSKGVIAAWHRVWVLREARRFPERRSERVTLRYEPGVERTLNLERQLLLWEQALEQLEKQFGFSLKRRLLVVVFATPKQARQLTRTTWATAAALMGDDLVVASVSSLGPHATETMRHELAHLFSASWLRLPNGLPFRDEGLATWIQGTVASSAVDHWAQMVARRGRLRPIGELFRMTRYPEAATEAFDLYVLAGSFAGYLIQTFGWESYRKFFGSVLAGNYSKVFSKVFGISLQEAEDQWLNQTLGCSGADVRVNRRLQMPYESLLKTVEQMSSKIERPRTLINLPERIAERRRQLYG